MMYWTDILLLSVALAMDCFAVSIVSGVVVRRWLWAPMVRMAVLFGLFQALMPLIGWLATSRFRQYIEDYDHWVAFGLLTFLGVRMIIDSRRPPQEQHFNPLRLSVQLTQAVATSIDALAVGISFAATGYGASQLTFPLLAIGAGSLVLSVAGCLLGIRFGQDISRRLQPELLGGLILLFIGVKILFE